jgi:hypothetical protein
MTALLLIVLWVCYLAWIATSRPERLQSHLLWLWAFMAFGVLLEFIPAVLR